MLKTKEQKAITLITLIITIIVMLILAGVTINLTLGENGIFAKAKEAKIKMEIATIKEQIQMDILTERLGNNGNILEDKLKEILEGYGELSKEEKIEDKTLTTDQGKHEIKVSDILDGEIVKGGGEDLERKIYTIILNISPEISLSNEKNTIEEGKVYNTSINVTEGYTIKELIVTMGGNEIATGEGNIIDIENKIISIANVSGNIEIKITSESEGELLYLADVVEIGDFVDINIEYKDLGTSSYGNYTTYDSSWRVLNIQGSGEDAYLNLVSTGIPLKYSFGTDPNNFTKFGKNGFNYYLNSIEPVDSGVGFTKNGFAFDHMGTVCHNSGLVQFNYANIFSTFDLAGLFVNLTGTSYTMDKLYNTNIIGTLERKLGSNWKDKYSSLICANSGYGLSGDPRDTTSIYLVSNGGYFSNTSGPRTSCRVTMRTYPGVRTKVTNETDGESMSSAYIALP